MRTECGRWVTCSWPTWVSSIRWEPGRHRSSIGCKDGVRYVGCWRRLPASIGAAVELAGLTCCCRPMISKGLLRSARDLIQAQLPPLAQRLATGEPLLGLEPSCLLTLADEWPELVPGAESQRVAAAAHLADHW